jgi:hypothetical protein
MAELYFTLSKINEVCVKARIRLALMGIDIIEDVNYTATSILKNDLVRYFNILIAVEGRKDYDWQEQNFQELVWILYNNLRLSTITISINPKFVEVGGGIIIIPIINLSFLNLIDTPSSYTGQANKVVSVNTAETGLEFVDIQTLITDLLNAKTVPLNLVLTGEGETEFIVSELIGMKVILLSRGVNLEVLYILPSDPLTESQVFSELEAEGGSTGRLKFGAEFSDYNEDIRILYYKPIPTSTPTTDSLPYDLPFIL